MTAQATQMKFGAANRVVPGRIARSGAVLLCTAVLISTMASYSVGDSGDSPRLDAATRAAVAAAPVLLGGPIAPRHIAGRPVVVTFFASWCAPCVAEFAHLAELHERYQGRGLRIIAVNYFETFDGLSNPARLAAFLKRVKPPFAVVKGDDRLALRFGGITRIPSLFLFDRQGRQSLFFSNAPDGQKPTLSTQELAAAIEPLL